LFAFAGIWDRWKGPSGKLVETCSILTTTPNAVTSAVHDRMPVILDRDNYDLWLDPGMRDVAALSELLKPCDARLMRCYPISTRINHVANNDEECSAPVELAQIQDRIAIRSQIVVSRWYADRIREGYQPHPRHWQALAKLARVSEPSRFSHSGS